MLAITGISFSAANAEQLGAADELLGAGKTGESAAAYANIDFDSGEWLGKVERALRYQSLQGKGDETWRIITLLKRVGLEGRIADSDYFLALALAQESVCPLNLSIADQEKAFLLEAYVYRYRQRFVRRPYSYDAYSAAAIGQRVNHYGFGTTPKLALIPKTQLIRGRGCWYGNSALENRDLARQREFQALKRWYGMDRAFVEGTAKIEMRLIELANALKDEETLQVLMGKYLQPDVDLYLKLPPEERRYILALLLENKLLPPDFGSQPEWKKVLIACSLSDLQGRGVDVLGYLNWEEVPAAEKEALIDQLLQLKKLPDRGYFLVERARLYYVRGEVLNALALIRRVLVLNEASITSGAYRQAESIGIAIFREYQFDKKVLGALENSLPKAIWASVLARMRIRHALLGQGKVVDQLGRKLAEAGRGTRQQKEAPVLTSLARRQLPGFKEAIGFQKKRLTQGILGLLGQIGGELIDLPPEVYRGLQPYRAAVQEMLQRHLGRSGVEQTGLTDLIQIFGQESAWNEGADAVVGDAIVAGAVDLNQLASLLFPIKPLRSSSLPRRPLLYVPIGVATAGWVIK